MVVRSLLDVVGQQVMAGWWRWLGLEGETCEEGGGGGGVPRVCEVWMRDPGCLR